MPRYCLPLPSTGPHMWQQGSCSHKPFMQSSIYLSIYLPTYLSIHFFIILFIYLGTINFSVLSYDIWNASLLPLNNPWARIAMSTIARVTLRDRVTVVTSWTICDARGGAPLHWRTACDRYLPCSRTFFVSSLRFFSKLRTKSRKKG